ncbi:hypothetical protein Q4543_03570 [Salipiger sp. 1_MG-2023]|uniref:hypothetical protein n=1 Tax=Salipiger sp. 1_MG-2023 TaxID=3062665 RepID=UPI0026E303BB|nr:hypothetical protein [Salipiger sp. 1_MG-2023]MDO6584587.1 hypothetical protein [Salipiger sp. 1_MG-2023]
MSVAPEAGTDRLVILGRARLSRRLRKDRQITDSALRAMPTPVTAGVRTVSVRVQAQRNEVSA